MDMFKDKSDMSKKPSYTVNNYTNPLSSGFNIPLPKPKPKLPSRYGLEKAKKGVLYAEDVDDEDDIPNYSNQFKKAVEPPRPRILFY
jgi:hypothetical protein